MVPGNLALAAVSAIDGLIAVPLLGHGQRRDSTARAARTPPGRQELGRLLRHPTLLLVIGGMLLVNVPGVFSSSQLKLVVMAGGVSSRRHVCVVAVCGRRDRRTVPQRSRARSHSRVRRRDRQPRFADDRLCHPRRFDIGNFSLLLSCVTASIVVGTALGSPLLGATLGVSGSHQPFLIVSAICMLVGATLFGLTGSARARGGTPDEVRLAAAVAEQPVIAGGMK